MPRDEKLPVDFRWRARVMGGLAAAAIGGLAARGIQLQVARGAEHGARLDAAKAERVVVPAPRGVIRDARGRVVAENRTAIDAYAEAFRPTDDRAVAKLAALLGLDEQARARLREPARHHPLLLRRDVAPEVAEAIRGDGELRWVRLVPRAARHYPFGPLAAHVVGYMNEVSGDDLARDPGYRPGDRIGRTGVERAFEKALRGAPGYELRPRTSRVTAPPGGEAPVGGGDVTLTLDMDLERAADEAFERRGIEKGAAIVLEVRTGRVLAMVSRPAFDPNLVDRGAPIPAEGRPEVDRALMDVGSGPGSAIKPFVALSALGADRAGADRVTTCRGFVEFGPRRYLCSHVHGRVDLEHAVAERCNVWFFEQAERLGIDALASVPQRLGLGAPTGIAVGREDAGLWPTRASYEARAPGAFKAGFALNTAIGQGDVRVTPMQLAVAYAALAGDGSVRAPRIVEGEAERVRASGVPAADLARVRAALPTFEIDRTFDGVFDGIRGGVAGLEGVGQLPPRFVAPSSEGEDADASPIPILMNDHWFAGFAPAGAPEVVVVVLAKEEEERRLRLREVSQMAADILRAHFMGGEVSR